ncbi:hypothetical protein EES40_07750 [Streptomyces sp. ADI93-02]|nr:hypothetical protein EES40_07750 [Streptomyces sp. ADI93-02]
MTESTYHSGYPVPVNRERSKSERVCVSSSKPVSVSATRSPYVSKGYGPTCFSIQSSCAGVFFSQGSSFARSAAGTTSRTGSPRGPVRWRTAERPMDTWASSVAMGCSVR